MWLLAPTTITTAVTAALSAVLVAPLGTPLHLGIQADFTYGSGGTSVDGWIQTSFDQGAKWCDIANFHFTTASLRKLYNLSALTPVTTQATPSDGTLAANTAVDGLIGNQFRLKYTSVGTYGGATKFSVALVSDMRLQAL